MPRTSIRLGPGRPFSIATRDPRRKRASSGIRDSRRWRFLDFEKPARTGGVAGNAFLGEGFHEAMDAGVHAAPTLHGRKEEGNLVVVSNFAFLFQRTDEAGDFRVEILGLGFPRSEDRGFRIFAGGADAFIGDAAEFACTILGALVDGIDEA